jgi:peptidoglycan/LPS O-acetylase OafA/YrhL
MTDLETRLAQVLAADAPAARDPLFRIEVMMRREQAALRRRIVAASALAFGVAILAAIGFVWTQTLPDGPGRLAALVAIGTVLTALLAAPYLGGTLALRGMLARTRTVVPRLRLWP